MNGVGGYVMYPCRVCVDPQGMTLISATKYAQLCLANMPPEQKLIITTLLFEGLNLEKKKKQ
ncbi:MAG: hypothetical protein GPJ51_08775 [Candidatus Heimdallarchaeota archaeon]|nr:hypothetical protein [Candidatus Heimdallarchaeota archaeon]